MYRTAVFICIVAVVGFFVLGVALALREEPEFVAVAEEPALVIDNPVRDIGEVPVGPFDVSFDVTNPAARPRRIIGFAEGCTLRCCFGPKNDPIVTIDPGQTNSFACRLEIRGTGPFETPMWMALEDNGIRNITLTVKGTGIAPAKDHEKP